MLQFYSNIESISGHFDGWLYESKSVEAAFTFYIYSDLTTSIQGTFANGNLIKGHETRIKGFRFTIFFASLNKGTYMLERYILFMFRPSKISYNA